MDLLVFDGLSDEELRKVIFLEIKNGSSQLTPRERQVKNAILEGRVEWDELRVVTN